MFHCLANVFRKLLMVARDRSLELYQIFDTCRLRGGLAAPSSAVVVVSHQASSSTQHILTTEAMRFNDCAKAFGAEIALTSENIANLTKLIKQQNLFDDGGDQIGPLTSAIKSKLQQLHDDLEVLIQLKAAASRSNADQSAWKRILSSDEQKQDSAQHSETIVNTLRSRLVKTGQDFKTVLQHRTKSLTDAASRRNNLLSDAPRTAESNVFGGGDLAQQQQLAMTNSNALYYRSRYDAVREIEAAVNEVSDIFHDFSVLVAEQNELIVRIDQDVDSALLNVNAGTNELMRYLSSVSSNRGLILKIFGILFFFLLFFGFVVVR